MDVEEASPTFSPPAVSGRESADPNDQADMPTPGAGKRKKEADAAPFIYSILTRDSPGGQIATMHSRVSSDALGMLSIAVGMTMPSPLEMATNIGNALKRNDVSLSTLGSRGKNGMLSPTQCEAMRFKKILGAPLERFEACQAALPGHNVAMVNFAAVRSSALGVSAVHEGGCIGLLNRLRTKAQSSELIHETSFCPVSRYYLGQTQCKSRNNYQRKKVIKAFSELLSSLFDAQGQFTRPYVHYFSIMFSKVILFQRIGCRILIIRC